eukprot:COSAG01_NODE_42400_length_440_cov_1.193548_1_plen_42_part_01
MSLVFGFTVDIDALEYKAGVLVTRCWYPEYCTFKITHAIPIQ